ncbi:MAG TPA: hypothetical protein VE987_21570 [Polyangiaceae bacterium]|nr:hypothetical protein [Polyangiaceae bacterium]
MTHRAPRLRAETFTGVTHWPASREGLVFLGLFVVAFAPPLVLSAVFHGEAGLLGFPWWALLFLAFSLHQRFVRRVTVGADGLWLHGWPFARFVPWSRVAALEEEAPRDLRPESTHLRVRLVDGDAVELRAVPARAPTLAALVEHARASMHGYRQRTAAPHADTLPLARAGREVSSWLRDLRAMLADRGDYRSAAVAPDALWAVLEDPGAEASARAGAAAALASHDPSTRARIRVAGEGSASPALQQTLVRISEAEADASVERALVRSR